MTEKSSSSVAETGSVKRRSSRLRFLRCFTALDNEKSYCSPVLQKETNDDGGRDAGRLTDLRRPSTPVTPRRQKKKRFSIFSRVVHSVFLDSSRGFVEGKKHGRRKRYRELSEWNDKLSRKQDSSRDITNSNKDFETDINIGSSSSSSLSTNMTSSSILSSSYSISSMSHSFSSSSRSFNSSSSSTCASKYKVIDSGLCLLVVILLVVIAWGKVCAIVCTSTWLFIMFGRSNPQMITASDPAPLLEETTMGSELSVQEEDCVGGISTKKF